MMMGLEPFLMKEISRSLLPCYKELDKALENLPVLGNSFAATIWTWLQFTIIVFSQSLHSIAFMKRQQLLGP